MADSYGPQSVPEDRTKRTKVVVPIPLGESPISISPIPPPRDRTDERRRPSRANPAAKLEHTSSDDEPYNANAPFSPKQGGNQSDISQPTSPAARRLSHRPTPQGLNVEDCLEYMVNFVEKCDLTKIVWRHDVEYESRLHRSELKEKLRPQAKIAAGLPTRMKFVNREFMNNFAILSLYDLAVLVDDSQSMAFEEKGDRIRAMKKVLAYLAHIYGLSSKDRGISAIRFLNGNDDLKANNLKEHEIDAVVDAHEFEGLTKIGTGLMSKILKPLVFADGVWNKQDKKPRKLRTLKRPLLIMIITDGAVEGEPAVRLPQAIKAVHESLKAAGYTPDTKAVVFQFARVGNDKHAQEYLEFLDDHSSVKELVDTMSGSDLMDLIGWHGGIDAADERDLSETQQRNMIKLLLGPINSQFDKLIEAEANCDDEFDDEEEDEWESYQFKNLGKKDE